MLCPFPTTEINAGAIALIAVRPQTRYRVRRLFLDPVCAPYVAIENIMTGNTSIVWTLGEAPGAWFADSEDRVMLAPHIGGPIVPPGTDLVLSLRNVSGARICVRGFWECEHGDDLPPENARPTDRTIVAMATAADVVIAACVDGTVWKREPGAWVPFEGIPLTPRDR